MFLKFDFRQEYKQEYAQLNEIVVDLDLTDTIRYTDFGLI